MIKLLLLCAKISICVFLVLQKGKFHKTVLGGKKLNDKDNVKFLKYFFTAYIKSVII